MCCVCYVRVLCVKCAYAVCTVGALCMQYMVCMQCARSVSIACVKKSFPKKNFGGTFSYTTYHVNMIVNYVI